MNKLIKDINLEIQWIGRINVTNEWGGKFTQADPYSRLYFVLKGKGKLEFNGQTKILKSGGRLVQQTMSLEEGAAHLMRMDRPGDDAAGIVVIDRGE